MAAEDRHPCPQAVNPQVLPDPQEALIQRRSLHQFPQPSAQSTHRVVVSNIFDLFVVIRSGQLSQAFRVELATVREQLCSVLLGQLSTK